MRTNSQQLDETSEDGVPVQTINNRGTQIKNENEPTTSNANDAKHEHTPSKEVDPLTESVSRMNISDNSTSNSLDTDTASDTSKSRNEEAIVKNIKIIQWNMNGYNNREKELQEIIKDYDPAILCLQETHFKEDHYEELEEYTTFIKNRTLQSRASGGVMIAVSTEYEATEIPLRTTLEAVAVTVCLPKEIHICNVYIPSNQDIKPEDIRRLIQQIPEPLLLVGDFNSHHTCWDNLRRKAGRRGKIVKQDLEGSKFELLNTGVPTYRHTTISAIDLSICSSTLKPHMNWCTLEDRNCNDHIPIQIIYDHIPTNLNQPTGRSAAENASSSRREEAQPESKSESGSGSESKLKSESESESEPRLESPLESRSKSASELDSELRLESQSESKSESEAGSGSESESESESESKSESESETEVKKRSSYSQLLFISHQNHQILKDN